MTAMKVNMTASFRTGYTSEVKFILDENPRNQRLGGIALAFVSFVSSFAHRLCGESICASSFCDFGMLRSHHESRFVSIAILR